MNDELVLWPSLKWKQFGELDYSVMQYDAEWLRNAAKTLRANEKSGAWAVNGALAYNVAELLEKLARTRAAVKALNHHKKGAAQNTRHLNIAVHYFARRERNLSPLVKVAQSQIAEIWSCTPAVVKEAVGACREEAKALIDNMVRLLLRNPQWARREDVIAALDEDMTKRATLRWLKQRKSAIKGRRRK